MGVYNNGREYGSIGSELFMVRVFKKTKHRPYDWKTRTHGEETVHDTVSEYGPYTKASAAANVGSQKAKGWSGEVISASYKVFRSAPEWEEVRDTIVISKEEN